MRSLLAPALTPPPGWRCVADPDHGLLLRALAPVTGSSGVVPSLRLELEPVLGGTDAWHAETVAGLESRLSHVDHDLEGDYELAGRVVRYRRLAHRRAGRELITEQWAWPVRGAGFLLTATVARAEYADYGEVFESVAATFDPDGASWADSA
jgi:hypothetical protein